MTEFKQITGKRQTDTPTNIINELTQSDKTDKKKRFFSKSKLNLFITHKIIVICS